MGSAAGVSDELLMAVAERSAGGFDADGSLDERTRLALRYADAMTTADVDDALFTQLRARFSDDELVELTEVIAWENASARFNRALRIDSQQLWAGPQSP